MPERAVDPQLARASRRAAAMLTHWQRKDASSDGEMAVLGELGSDVAEWTAMVCALLNLTTGLVKAAKDGREDAYLAYVLNESALDEVSGRG